MPRRADVRQQAAPRAPRVSAAWTLAFVRVFALVTLLLLPVQMRAGGADAHPHALLQLVLDARDGSFDHHATEHVAGYHMPNAAPDADSASPQPDLPTIGDASSGGGMAILAAIVVCFAVPKPVAARAWAMLIDLRGWLPALEPPPPRLGCV